MRDIGLLAWLQWRHLRSRLRFWGAIAGMDAENRSLTNRLYGAYLVLIGTAWMYAMWASVTDLVFGIGLGVTPARGMLVQALAYLPILALIVMSMRALRTSPVRFTFPDIAYVAGSTLDRGAITLLGAVREIAPLVLVAGFLGYLAAIMLATGEGVRAVIGPAVGSAAGMAGSIAVADALAWMVGVWRLALSERRPWPEWAWLMPPVLLALPLLAPMASAAAGAAITAPLEGHGLAGPGVTLAVLLLALAGVWRIGRRLDTVRVTEESGLYAQIQVYRPLAIYDARAVRDIVRRKRLAARRPRGTMPTGHGRSALIARAWISTLRQPRRLFAALVIGLSLAPTAALLAVEPHPLVVYFPWFFALFVAPTADIVAVFADDLDRPSIREVLPFDNLVLLLADAVPSLIVMLVSTVLMWSAMPPLRSAGVVSLLIALCLGSVLLLCRGLDHVRILGLRRPLGFPVTAAASSAIVLYSCAEGSLLLGAIAAVSCVILLAWALRASHA